MLKNKHVSMENYVQHMIYHSSSNCKCPSPFIKCSCTFKTKSGLFSHISCYPKFGSSGNTNETCTFSKGAFQTGNFKSMITHSQSHLFDGFSHGGRRIWRWHNLYRPI